VQPEVSGCLEGHQRHLRGDEDFCSRRNQKLLLREIMSVEPAVPRPLRWSEVPISFSHDD
jgi:ribonuclease HI